MQGNYLSLVAHIHSLCCIVIIVFHSLLILGKPWGHLTMGGKFKGVLPTKMKVVSAVSILILFLFLLIVEISAGTFLIELNSVARIALWFVIGYNIIGVVLHIITPSKWERILWLPLILVMLATSSLIMVNL